MRVDRQSAYTSDITGIPLPPPTPPRPSIISPSLDFTMDIPALTDNADDLHYLNAITPTTDVWSGAVLQRSLDGGANFVSINSTDLNAIVGVLQEPVPSASPYYTDTTNRLVIDLYTDDELESISQQQFLSEGGAFALSWMDGAIRRWEIGQARDVQQDSSGVWTLSTLQRGRLNTEAAAHTVGDIFVLLDGSILKTSAQTSWLGAELTHRAVSNGLSPETAPQDTIVYTGNSQREWPVTNVFLELDGADLNITIVPRHRFGTDDNPIRSINWTGYQIFASAPGQAETIITTSDTATINVAGWTGTITVEVSQLNRLTGEGPEVTETIES
jgi:hypothetical protein